MIYGTLDKSGITMHVLITGHLYELPAYLGETIIRNTVWLPLLLIFNFRGIA